MAENRNPSKKISFVEQFYKPEAVQSGMAQTFLNVTKELSDRKAMALKKTIAPFEKQVEGTLISSSGEKQSLVELYYNQIAEIYYGSAEASTDIIKRELLPTLEDISSSLRSEIALSDEEKDPLLKIIGEAQDALKSRISVIGRVAAKTKALAGSGVVQSFLAGAVTDNPLVALAVFAASNRANKKKTVEIEESRRQASMKRGEKSFAALDEATTPTATKEGGAGTRPPAKALSSSAGGDGGFDLGDGEGGGGVVGILTKQTATLERIDGSMQSLVGLFTKQFDLQQRQAEESAFETSERKTAEREEGNTKEKKTEGLFGKLFLFAAGLKTVFEGIKKVIFDKIGSIATYIKDLGLTVVNAIRSVGAIIGRAFSSVVGVFRAFLPQLVTAVTGLLPFVLPAAIVTAELAAIKALLEEKLGAFKLRKGYEEEGLKKIAAKDVAELQSKGIDTTFIEQARSEDEDKESHAAVRRRAIANTFLSEGLITPEEVQEFKKLGGDYRFREKDGKMLPQIIMGSQGREFKGFTNEDAERYLRARQMVRNKQTPGGVFGAALGANRSAPPPRSSATPTPPPTSTTPPPTATRRGGGTNLPWQQDTEFLSEVGRVAQKYNINQNDLLSVMARESGINPQAVNSNTNATGLIQFMPDTAQSLGTSVEELSGMSRAEQMVYVDRFFAQNKLRQGADLGEIYATIFLPARRTKDIIARRGETGTDYYTPNAGLDLDKDGIITKAELGKTAEISGKSFGVPSYAPSAVATGGDLVATGRAAMPSNLRIASAAPSSGSIAFGGSSTNIINNGGGGQPMGRLPAPVDGEPIVRRLIEGSSMTG